MMRFVVVGGSTALGYFLLLLAADALNLPPLFSHPAAYLLAFAVAYRLQHGWTFKAAASHGHAFPRYLGTQFLCACHAGVLGYATGTANWPPMVAALGVTLAVSAISFLFSSRWVFRPPSPPYGATSFRPRA